MADYKIDQIKAQYPQYAALTDDELGIRLHKKHYADMDYGEFEQRMGIADKRRETMYDQMIGEMSMAESAMVGAGKAASDFVSGLKQWGLRGGEALGFFEPGTAEAHRQTLAQENRLYSELADRSTAATVGNIGGNVALFALPGGALARTSTFANAGLKGRSAMGALYGAGEMTATTPVLSEDFWGEKVDQAGLGAVFGVGGELAGELVSAGIKHFTKNKQASQEAVDNFLAQNGIDPGQLSDDYRREIAEQINSNLNAGADDITAAIEGIQDARLQRGDDFVPMTAGERKGILAGNYDDWALQKEAEMGAHGNAAQQQVVGFERMRDGMLADGVTRQFSDLGPLDQITDLQAPAAKFAQGIEDAVESAKTTKKAAYDAVNMVEMQAFPDVYSEALEAIRGGFDGNIKLFSKTETPNAYALYKEVDDLLWGGSPDPADGLPGALAEPGLDTYGLASFESLRRRINAAIGSSEKQDKALLVQVKRNYDNWFDQAVDGGRFIGDQANFAALKSARAANRDYMSIVEGTYKDGKPTVRTKMVQDVINGRTTPEALVNQLMGATGTKQNARAIEDLRQLLGNDSAEFGALKQAGFMNIFGKGLEMTDDGLKIKRGNYANAILDKVKNNRTTLETLYGKPEVERWVSFANDLKRIQPDLKTLNPSGTSYSQKRINNRVAGNVVGALADFFGHTPFIGKWVGGALGEVIETVRNRSIYEMMRKGGMVSTDFTTSKALDDRLRAILASGVREEGKQSGIRPGGVLSQ